MNQEDVSMIEGELPVQAAQPTNIMNQRPLDGVKADPEEAKNADEGAEVKNSKSRNR